MVHAKGNGSLSGDLKLQVVKLYQPFTLSCVMQVDVLQEGNQPWRAVLKLFERCFAEQQRADENIPPWSQDIEKADGDFVRSGAAKTFL